MKTLRVPEATVTRLSIYSRFLERLDKNGVITVSSGDIAEGVGVSPAQVRKDLAYFGEFGTRGVGYNVKDLMKYTLRILGLDKSWSLLLVGAGNLGFALCTYKGFNIRGFTIKAVFDNHPTKVGKQIGDLEVQSLDSFENMVEKYDAKIGIIAVPPKAAQEVADLMVKTGLKAILNFAPVALNIPDNVELRNVDLSVKLEILTFNLGFHEAENI